MEHAQNRLSYIENLAGRKKVVQKPSRLAKCGGPPANRHPKTALRACVDVTHARVKADVVERSSCAIGLASTESDLELAGQRRAERMAQEIAGHRLRIWRHAEGLGWAH